MQPQVTSTTALQTHASWAGCALQFLRLHHQPAPLVRTGCLCTGWRMRDRQMLDTDLQMCIADELRGAPDSVMENEKRQIFFNFASGK